MKHQEMFAPTESELYHHHQAPVLLKIQTQAHTHAQPHLSPPSPSHSPPPLLRPPKPWITQKNSPLLKPPTPPIPIPSSTFLIQHNPHLQHKQTEDAIMPKNKGKVRL